MASFQLWTALTPGKVIAQLYQAAGGTNTLWAMEEMNLRMENAARSQGTVAER